MLNRIEEETITLTVKRHQLAIVQSAVLEYRELISSPTSADRDALGDEWADQEVDAADALLNGELAAAKKALAVTSSASSAGEVSHDKDPERIEKLNALGFNDEAEYQEHQRVLQESRNLAAQQTVLSRTEAMTKFKELVQKHGLQWTAAVPKEAYEQLRECNKVLTTKDRLEALGFRF